MQTLQGTTHAIKAPPNPNERLAMGQTLPTRQRIPNETIHLRQKSATGTRRNNQPPRPTETNRVALRALMRRLSHNQPASKTIGTCGLPHGGTSPGRLLFENGRMTPGQVQACQQGLRCPYCSPKQWEQILGKVDWYSTQHETQGGWFAETTLTVPHTTNDKLADLLDRLSKSMAGLRNHADFRDHRDALNASHIAALQIKWNPKTGWHPHYHVTWLMAGDRDRFQGFANATNSAWGHQTSRLGGRATHAHSEFIQNRQGFWEYLSTESGRHPNNDCLHPRHKGCFNCRPRGEWGGKPVPPTKGPQYPTTPGPQYPTTPGPQYPATPGPQYPTNTQNGFEVFNELGWSALNHSKTAQALLAEYIGGTAGYGRIRSLAHLSRRFGTPPQPERTRHQPGGKRTWITANLAASVELMNRGRTSPLDIRDRDPLQLAEEWSTLTGHTVTVGQAADDGSPLIQFA